MRFHVALLASLALVALPVGCAQILGYDGLNPRQDDASLDALGDALDEADVADTGPQPIHPPARPAGLPQTASGTGKTLTLAVKRVYLGTQTHLGDTTSTAWQEWGYDLDGLCTDLNDSTQSLFTCRRVDGSTNDVLVDGQRCRDNNFGSQIMALVMTYNTKVEITTDLSLLGGSGTLALVLSDVDPGDDGYAPGALYRIAGMPSGDTPVWDGTDVRTVTADSVTGGDLTKPVVTFPGGYIAGDLWVSGDPASFALEFGVQSTRLVLPIQSGTITIALDAARTGSPQPALIAGAISTSDVGAAMSPIAEQAGLCPGNGLYDGLIAKLQTFPDVVIGAPNLQDTTKTCDGISIGLGFDLAPIRPLATVVPAPAPPTSKCP